MLEDIIRQLVEELRKQEDANREATKNSPARKAEPDTKTPAIPEPPADEECKEIPRDLWSEDLNSIETDIDVEYDPDTGKYHIDDEEYDEGAAVWHMLDFGISFGCNLDQDQPFDTHFKPTFLPIGNFYKRQAYGSTKIQILPILDEIGRERRPLPNEADFIYAIKHCVEHDTPGFFIFCRDGEFRVLVRPHYYFEEGDLDNLICIFNARRCTSGYRKSWLKLNAEVDAWPLSTSVRYVPGDLFAWEDGDIADLKNELSGGCPCDYDD